MPGTTSIPEPDFRALFERGPELFLVLDPQLRIVAASDAYCKTTLTTRSEILGKQLFDVFPENPADRENPGAANLRASLERVLTLRQPDVLPLQRYDIPRPDGSGGGFEERYGTAVNAPILDEKGNVLWIVHRPEDATEFVRRNSIDAGFNVLAREQQDTIDRLRAANRELAATIDLLLPPELEDEEDRILDRLRSGESIDRYVTGRIRKDGAEIPDSITVSPLRNPAGEIIGASKIARDVTEKHKAEARLEDLQSRVIHLERWNMMGMMAATLAHELNQPLSAIANYAAALKHMLANPGVPTASCGEILDKIVRQRERASEIVSRLRKQVARGDADRRLERLDAVVAEALELVASTTQRAGVSVSFEAAPSLPDVLIDRVQIQQVAIDLARNAVEAMETVPSKTLTVSVGREGGRVRVGVADCGTGLSEEIAGRLFQPFVTTKCFGMGLGLAICRDIIEKHRGQLWAEPNAPCGTVFFFTIPAFSGGAAD